MLGYTCASYDSERRIRFGGIDRKAEGDFDGDGFAERGAGSLNLKVDDADTHSLVTSIGVRLGTGLQTENTSIRPRVPPRYDHDWNARDEEDHEIVLTFADVPVIGPIDIVGQSRGEHAVLLAGGVHRAGERVRKPVRGCWLPLELQRPRVKPRAWRPDDLTTPKKPVRLVSPSVSRLLIT